MKQRIHLSGLVTGVLIGLLVGAIIGGVAFSPTKAESLLIKSQFTELDDSEGEYLAEYFPVPAVHSCNWKGCVYEGRKHLYAEKDTPDYYFTLLHWYNPLWSMDKCDSINTERFK